jgi:hypothetical protein
LAAAYAVAAAFGNPELTIPPILKCHNVLSAQYLTELGVVDVAGHKRSKPPSNPAKRRIGRTMATRSLSPIVPTGQGAIEGVLAPADCGHLPFLVKDVANATATM